MATSNFLPNLFKRGDKLKRESPKFLFSESHVDTWKGGFQETQSKATIFLENGNTIVKNTAQTSHSSNARTSTMSTLCSKQVKRAFPSDCGVKLPAEDYCTSENTGLLGQCCGMVHKVQIHNGGYNNACYDIIFHGEFMEIINGTTKLTKIDVPRMGFQVKLKATMMNGTEICTNPWIFCKTTAEVLTKDSKPGANRKVEFFYFSIFLFCVHAAEQL